MINHVSTTHLWQIPKFFHWKYKCLRKLKLLAENCTLDLDFAQRVPKNKVLEFQKKYGTVGSWLSKRLDPNKISTCSDKWISLDKRIGHYILLYSITARTTDKRVLLWVSDWSIISYRVSTFLWLPFKKKALGFLGKLRLVFVALKWSPRGLNHGQGQ